MKQQLNSIAMRRLIKRQSRRHARRHSRRRYANPRGFTLIEVIIVVAILAALAASAIYALSPGDKISAAEETGLRQILVSRVPTELTQHRLKNSDISKFKFSSDNVAFMKNWPGVLEPKFTIAQRKLTLEMETTFDAAALRDTLTTMQGVTASINSAKVLKVEYKVS